MATVTAPSPGAPRRIVLATSSSAPGPAAARAAASATLAVPTSAATTAEGFGTGIAARAAASNRRRGQLFLLARASRAGSSPLRLRLASPATAPGARPPSPRAESSADAIRVSLLWRSQPTPTQSRGGCQRQPGPWRGLIQRSAGAVVLLGLASPGPARSWVTARSARARLWPPSLTRARGSSRAACFIN